MMNNTDFKAVFIIVITILLFSCQAKDQVLVEQGRAYINSGNYKKAIEVYNEAIHLNPNNAKAYYYLGSAYGRLGQYQEAIEPLKKAVLLRPDWVEGLFSLGGAYARMDRYQDAVEPLKQALIHSQEIVEAYIVLGAAYTQLGQYNKALETYKQAISVNPNFALARRNLARLYLAIGKKDEAINEYNTLKSLDLKLAESIFAQISKGAPKNDIEIVKNSTMPGYDSTTIGKAFDMSFDSPNWTSFESRKGERIVEFIGKIPDYLHNEYIKSYKKTWFLNVDSIYIVFKAAVDNLGGPEGQFFIKMNKKYNCKGPELLGEMLGSHGYRLNFVNSDLEKQYMQETVEEFLNKSWEIGSPVAVQWLILPDGKSVRLVHMSSPSWFKGTKYNEILDIIYNSK